MRRTITIIVIAVLMWAVPLMASGPLGWHPFIAGTIGFTIAAVFVTAMLFIHGSYSSERHGQ